MATSIFRQTLVIQCCQILCNSSNLANFYAFLRFSPNLRISTTILNFAENWHADALWLPEIDQMREKIAGQISYALDETPKQQKFVYMFLRCCAIHYNQ